MKCPACNAELLLSERQGIEIDYCPSCRGVWLDRGELDKIIERSSPQARVQGYGSDYRQESHHERHGEHHDDHDYYIDPRTGKRKRKGGALGFLGELFD